MGQTPALQYVISKGWTYKESGSEKIELETCPFCKKNNYGHFYMNVREDNQDGLWMCHRCGKSGNLITLKEEMGDKIRGVDSRSEWAVKDRKIEPMPNILEAHQALLEDADAMDYLINTRGFSREIIERQKLGLTSKRYFRKCGEVRALLYPYLVQGNPVFAHWRSLPPSPKDFSSLQGWDAPLYNSEALREGITEITMVEGEANTIAALDHNVENIVGVPGANFKKAMWIDTLDQIGIEKVYICYDKDKVGQKAAQTLASRIGIEKCWKITLPDFQVPTDTGTRVGKDINEWFVYGGGTKEAFEQLKETAELFDVQGVSSSKSALDEFEDFLDGKQDLLPTYKTPWEPLNKLVGFEDGDVIDLVAPEKIGKTTVGLNLIEYAVDQYDEDGIIICFEMPVIRLVRKWVSHVTRTDDSIPKSPEEAKLRLDAMKQAVKLARRKTAMRGGDLYFCYPQIKDMDDVYKLIVDCIRRYGVRWVMIDNLQLICDRTLKPNQNRTIHLSQISKTLAGIAKDYGIKMLRILQPHRIKDGAIISTNDVDGSSQVAKDCDCMMTAHRNPVGEMSQSEFESMGYVETETAFDPKMLLTVGLSRYSCGGYVTLYFDGATSTVTEYDTAGKVKLDAAKPVDGYAVPVEKVADGITV